MLSLPAFVLLLGFIGPPILAYVIFTVLARKRLLEQMRFKILSDADPNFVKFIQWAVLWFLFFGCTRLIYGWIHEIIFN